MGRPSVGKRDGEDGGQARKTNYYGNWRQAHDGITLRRRNSEFSLSPSHSMCMTVADTERQPFCLQRRESNNIIIRKCLPETSCGHLCSPKEYICPKQCRLCNNYSSILPLTVQCLCSYLLLAFIQNNVSCGWIFISPLQKHLSSRERQRN
jgi:hypothetical protein